MQLTSGRGNQNVYLVEHLFEVLFGTVPGRNCIAEEYEFVNDATRVDAYHSAYSSKRRILFFVITNITQRGTPEQQNIHYKLRFKTNLDLRFEMNGAMVIK